MFKYLHRFKIPRGYRLAEDELWRSNSNAKCPDHSPKCPWCKCAEEDSHVEQRDTGYIGNRFSK